LKSAATIGSFSLMPNAFGDGINNLMIPDEPNLTPGMATEKSVVGAYGQWMASNLEDPPQLSFRRAEYQDPETWKPVALEKAKELIAAPKGPVPSVTIKKQYEHDGVTVEELEWQLGYGRPTEAILVKPANLSGKLPGVLGLHDHGGQKYFGKRKITKTSDEMHPVMKDHQRDYYSGKAWANDLAKKGYVVLVHDVFTFGSRRVWYKDIAGINSGPCNVDDKTDDNPEDPKNIDIYNEWAANHEHIMSKSLFCGGTTWPGVTLSEDQLALSILSDRDEVDESNLGCCGLSGGGLRTDFLGGFDPRVKCAISVGFMSTWRDFLLNKVQTHTWMTYAPLLPKYLDFPEILGLRVPLPTMVMSCNEDQLYTLPEMKRADQILASIYQKAGASDHYQGRFYSGGHKFDAEMQKDAFDWFDRWLK
jgi:dienelactone hydrolase